MKRSLASGHQLLHKAHRQSAQTVVFLLQRRDHFLQRCVYRPWSSQLLLLLRGQYCDWLRPESFLRQAVLSSVSIWRCAAVFSPLRRRAPAVRSSICVSRVVQALFARRGHPRAGGWPGAARPKTARSPRPRLTAMRADRQCPARALFALSGFAAGSGGRALLRRPQRLCPAPASASGRLRRDRRARTLRAGVQAALGAEQLAVRYFLAALDTRVVISVSFVSSSLRSILAYFLSYAI